MSEYFNVPGATRVLHPQAVVLMDPLTGLPYASAPGERSYATFYKVDPQSPCFIKTGTDTLDIKAGTVVEVAGWLSNYATQTPVTMPALSPGVDYAVFSCSDGTLRADASFTAPAGYTTTNSRRIGGFHFAPGGNALARAGGNDTPQINEYSLWDVKFRPACPDPRGMAMVANAFWADIYLTGVDHYTNGTSKYNVTIADGSSPPKIPALFGGTGTTAYTTLTWWEAAEIATSHGKRLPTYAQFAALAFGVTEASSNGTDPAVTTWAKTYVSKFGCNQATGMLWQWGDEFGGGAAASSWSANTSGRGSTSQMENAVIFGGRWGDGASSGSRCSFWSLSPTNSSSIIGLRCVCDPCILA